MELKEKVGLGGFRKEKAVHLRKRTLPAEDFLLERHLSQTVEGHGGWDLNSADISI